MKKTNASITPEYFQKFNSKPVMLSNLSKSDSPTLFFYNSFYGSTTVGISKLNFKISDVEYDNIFDIKNADDIIDKVYNIVGVVRWIGESSTTPLACKSPSRK